MGEVKLFMLLLGCGPKGRHTEQHDVFFSVGSNLRELVPQILEFWPEAGGNIHIDAWREVNWVDNHTVQVVQRTSPVIQDKRLFFLNLGGYKENEFEEFHYKMLAVASGKGVAVQQAKKTAFYKHTGFGDAPSHIDDKYGVDVDDVYELEDILPPRIKDRYSIAIAEGAGGKDDKVHLGYFQLHKL